MRSSLRLAVVLVLLLSACGDGSPPRDPAPPPPRLDAPTALQLDLLAEFPIALVERETSKIEFGGDQDRHRLVSGWGENERDKVRGFVWGLGASSHLHFFAADAVDLELAFEVRAFHFPEAPTQGITLELNGQTLGEVEVGADFDVYRVAAPARWVQRGRNQLRFLYRHHHRPRDVLDGTEDERPLAVLWYDLQLRGLENAEVPKLGEDGQLWIPRGTRLSFFDTFTAGSELALGDLQSLGSGTRLQVEVETLEGELLASQTFKAEDNPPAPMSIPASTEPARLSLTAIRPAPEEAVASWRETLGRWMGGDPPGMELPLAVVMGTENPPDNSTRLANTETIRRPNILVYLIDTLRADHMSLYGYSRPTTPRIDAFGQDAIVFTQARAQTSWTRTAVASLFTGMLPQVHGVNRREDAMSTSLETLAERLGSVGYSTLGFITNGNVSDSFGLEQGFDHYQYLRESHDHWSVHQLSDRLNGWAFKWLDDRRAQKITDGEQDPFFLYLHSTDPHGPYTPPEPFYSQFAAHVDRAVGQLENVHAISTGQKEAPPGTAEDFIDLYDAEIAFNDHHFGLLLDRLKAEGLYDSSLIVLLSDHGEEFFEHGDWEHGKTLYDEQLRIPLVVKLPHGEGAGTRIDTPAHQIDVLPTVLDYIGMKAPPTLDGRSLLPLLKAEETVAPISFAYLRLGEQHQESAVGHGHKLIRDLQKDRAGRRIELYGLQEDPGEQRDLSSQGPLAGGFLRQQLEELGRDLRLRSRGVAPEKAEMSEELRKRLEALGYVQ